MEWSGKIMMFSGIVGFVFTLFFDKIAGRVVVEFGWVQVSGLLLTALLFCYGIVLEQFMKTVKDLLDGR
jgi:hypothetical protein